MANNVSRVVIAVFDGLRPDRISQALTPNLHGFLAGGLWYREARSVFPSMTRVATTSFATGSHPSQHGIVNNAFFHPAIEGGEPLDTSRAAHIRSANAWHDGAFVEAEGLGCVLAAAGKRLAVVHSGSAGSAWLLNHRAREHGHWTFSINGRDHSDTPEAVDQAVERFGALPAGPSPKLDQATYATRVLTELVLPELQSDVSVIWYSEPDTSYHFHEIGSQQSAAATAHVDACFGRVLHAVRASAQADETMLIVMSDHGQIATTSAFDLVAALRARGFEAGHRDEAGTEVLVTPGATAGITLKSGDPVLLQSLGAALMEMPQTGMLFCRAGEDGEPVVDGTFDRALVGADHSRAPDIYWVGRSCEKADQHGLAGSGIYTTGVNVPVGGGMHGGLNPYEMNTLLAFAGAGIAAAHVNDHANLTDIVPTVLAALGLDRPASMTGLPLDAVFGKQAPESRETRHEAGAGEFRQYLVRAAGSGRQGIPLRGGRI
ncbi:alkaline phosphatase family protein [uncultured Hoeflea sp.]|uniref:alkaline phosphatase family protein n=1 Tax=uncultured Hoeflea sp. TaxID=538666 RepID=UPI0030EF13B3